MRKLAESKKNMRVDMRPKVVAKIMTKEILLGGLALACAIGMPLYYLKI